MQKVSCFHFFLVGQGMKWANFANIWPKMTKKANLGPNLAVFRPNILILTGGRKSFGTHVTWAKILIFMGVSIVLEPT